MASVSARAFMPARAPACHTAYKQGNCTGAAAAPTGGQLDANLSIAISLFRTGVYGLCLADYPDGSLDAGLLMAGLMERRRRLQATDAGGSNVTVNTNGTAWPRDVHFEWLAHVRVEVAPDAPSMPPPAVAVLDSWAYSSALTQSTGRDDAIRIIAIVAVFTFLLLLLLLLLLWLCRRQKESDQEEIAVTRTAPSPPPRERPIDSEESPATDLDVIAAAIAASREPSPSKRMIKTVYDVEVQTEPDAEHMPPSVYNGAPMHPGPMPGVMPVEAPQQADQSVLAPAPLPLETPRAIALLDAVEYEAMEVGQTRWAKQVPLRAVGGGFVGTLRTSPGGVPHGEVQVGAREAAA